MTTKTVPSASFPLVLGRQYHGDLRADGLVRLLRRLALYLTGSVEDGGLGFHRRPRRDPGPGHLLPLPVPCGFRRAGRPLRLQEDVPGIGDGDGSGLRAAVLAHGFWPFLAVYFLVAVGTACSSRW